MKKISLFIVLLVSKWMCAQQSDSLANQIRQSKSDIRLMKSELRRMNAEVERKRRDTLKTLTYTFPILFQAGSIQSVLFNERERSSLLRMQSEYAVGVEAQLFVIVSRRMRLGVGAFISRLDMQTDENLRANSSFRSSDTVQSKLLNAHTREGITMSGFSLSLGYLFKVKKIYVEPFLKPGIVLFNYQDNMLYYEKSATTNSYVNLWPKKRDVSMAWSCGVSLSKPINRFTHLKASVSGAYLLGRHTYVRSVYGNQLIDEGVVDVQSPKFMMQSNFGILFLLPRSIHSDQIGYYSDKMKERVYRNNY